MIGSMTVQELKEKLDKKEDIILIDVREQGEWDEAHIEEAQFLPLSNFDEEMKKLTNPNAVVVCQCRSGKRSLNAAMMLQDEGFENLFNLEGGILAWQDAGFPTV